MSTATSTLVPARRRAPAEKRERLLAAARDLFSRQGFDRTSTQQIARSAGVSEGILFHHFGSKLGLFEQLAREYAEAAAEASMPANAGDLTEEVVVRGAFAFADANPAMYEMMMHGSTQLAELDLASFSESLVAAIARNLGLGIEAGVVRKGDAAVMAELQFAVVDGAYKAWRRSGDPRRREDYILEAITCMQAMLAPIDKSRRSR